MRIRRITSFLLCIAFAVSAATGILFMPAIRFLVGINNEGFWRLVHFYSTNVLVGLICEHIILNRKALWNYLKTARVLGIFTYTLATIVFTGVIYLGIFGPDLGLTGFFWEETLRRARSTPEPTLITFPENFEDGGTDGWRLSSGWEVKLDAGNYVLSGLSDRWTQAKPQVSGWFNYTIETRIKLIKGKIHLNLRTSEVPFNAGYALGMSEKELYLNRFIDNKHLNVSGGKPILKLNEWHVLKVILNGTNIKVYLDDELKLDYTDTALPVIFGGFNLNIAPDSNAFFDDINVTVGELTQMMLVPVKPTP